MYSLSPSFFRRHKEVSCMQDMDVLDDYEDVPGAPRRSGGFLGKLIAVLLGLIIGILAGAGGVAGIAYVLIAKTNIKTNMNTVNGFLGTDIDYADYINGKYGEKTLIDFAGDTITAIQKVSQGEGTLNTLNDISPMVGKLLLGEDGNSGLVATLNGYYLNIVPEEFMDRIVVKPSGATKDPNKYLLDYMSEKLDNVPVVDFLLKMGYPLNDIILTVGCGVEGVDYIKNSDGTVTMLNGKKQLTVKEFLSSDLQQAISRLPIDAIMSIPLNDKFLAMLAYGDDLRYTVVDGKAVMNQVFYTYDINEQKFYDYSGADVTANVNPESVDLTNYTCEIVMNGATQYLQAQNIASDTVTFYAYSTTDYTETYKIVYQKLTLADLQNGTTDLIDKMYLKDVLAIDANSDEMLLALAYGVKGVNYDIQNGEIIELTTPRTVGDLRNKGTALLDELLLCHIVDTDVNNNLIMYILYGKKGLHYSTDGTNVTMLQKQVAVLNGTVYNEYGDVLIGELNGDLTFVEDGKTYKLGDETGKTLKINNENATLCYVVDEQDNPVNFPYISLGDLKGNSPILEKLTTRLTLSDVLSDTDLTTNNVLKHIIDTPIAQIPAKLNDLTIGEIISDADTNPVLKHLQDATLSNLSTKVKELTFNQVFEADIYETDGTTLKTIWKYMLYDNVNTPSATVPTYYIVPDTTSSHKGLNDMMSNMENNMKCATLDTLVNDGLITVSDETQLNTQVSYNGNMTMFRDMTIEQLLDYILTLTHA